MARPALRTRSASARTGRRPRALAQAAVALGLLTLGIAIGSLLGSRDAGSDTPRSATRVVPVPSAPGPPRVQATRTPSGAARAAARALAALADPRLLTDGGGRRAAVSAIAPAAYRSEMAPLFDRSYDYLADTLGRSVDAGQVVLRMAPVGYRVEAFSARRATVAVWQVTLLGTAERDPIAAWATSRAELVWIDGRWRVERFGRDVPGPTPSVTAPGTPTPAAEFVALANDLAPFAP